MEDVFDSPEQAMQTLLGETSLAVTDAARAYLLKWANYGLERRGMMTRQEVIDSIAAPIVAARANHSTRPTGDTPPVAAWYYGQVAALCEVIGAKRSELAHDQALAENAEREET